MKLRLFFLGVMSPALLGAGPLELKSGDRVALVGNTVIERAQRFGHFETMLNLAAGESVKDVTFRNLGWSGDSVFGDARSYFGPPKEGRDRLKKAIGEVEPTVLLVCYGTNAAMTEGKPWTGESAVAGRSEGSSEEGLALFLEGYGKLLDLMEEGAGEALRKVVLISPPPLENLAAPYPDQAANNKRLALYRDAIRFLAKSRGYRFADLYEAMGGDHLVAGRKTETPLTHNGVHYGEAGYAVMAGALVKELGMAPPESLSANAPSVVALRETIMEKNRLFFHRWRPANETYLFLFRKHEQGNNAREIPLFDPLIAAEEEKIETLRAEVFKKLK